jgi:hypothetical protein
MESGGGGGGIESRIIVIKYTRNITFRINHYGMVIRNRRRKKLEESR